jgi:hypothetical protein
MKTYTMTLLAGIAIGATALQGFHRAAQRQNPTSQVNWFIF